MRVGLKRSSVQLLGQGQGDLVYWFIWFWEVDGGSVWKSVYCDGSWTTVLDGDSVVGLCEGLDFSAEGRAENLRRVAGAI